MSQWTARRRRGLAAAVASVVGGMLLATPATPAQAQTAEIDLTYRCRGGLVSSTPVQLKATLTVQTALTVGQPLDIRWDIKYADTSRFVSPDYFAAGGRLSATGAVKVTGQQWSGELHSSGAQEQERLRKGDALTLPSLISGAVSTTQPGTFEIVPERLTLGFIPPASERIVNDDDPAVTYHGDHWRDDNDRPAHFNDIHNDVHATDKAWHRVEFKFTGTGVDFITEQDYRAGRLEFKIDGRPGVPQHADASKDENGNPVTVVNRGNHTLWSVRGLPYGEHTLEITNTEDKWAIVDGFRVVTEELLDPPSQFRVTCTAVNKPTAIRVVISEGGAGSPSNGPGNGGPSSTPSVSPSNGNGGNGDGGGNGNESPSPGPSDGGQSPSPGTSGSPTPSGSPRPTVTTTVTATATPTVAQVLVTPRGGVQTGEAPAGNAAGAAMLLGSGGLLLALAAGSGVALARRRAAHATGPAAGEGGDEHHTG